MNSMKAENLVVQSFRGINDEISLDLEDFTILYGENGTGKSSFVNSLEYLFIQKLDFLSRSTIKKSAYVIIIKFEIKIMIFNIFLSHRKKKTQIQVQK